jgi:ankyrin repeat protein
LMFAAERGYIGVVRFLVEFQSSKPREAERIHSQEEGEESGDNGNNQAPISPDEAFGPLVRGYDGRTALHIALNNDHGEVAAYLLHDTDQVQENPHDRDMNTLLVAAASNQSSSTCFSSILKRWPEIINQPDSEFGLTPLSWACEMGFESIVDMLLTCEKLDLNKPAPGWMNYTPLHSAVTRNHVTIVQKLLSNENIVIDAKDSYNETAIDMAADAQIMQALLTHRLTSSKGRLEFLLHCCKFGEETMQKIMPEILEHIDNADITDKDLVELIDISEDIHTSAPYIAFVKRAFNRDTWKSMDCPYHKVVRIGSLELVRLLIDHGSDPADVDEDAWSCIDYANTYRSTKLEDSILHVVLQQPSWKLVQPPIEKPRLLHYSEMAGSVEVSSCNEFGHKECLGINCKAIVTREILIC